MKIIQIWLKTKRTRDREDEDINKDFYFEGTRNLLQSFFKTYCVMFILHFMDVNYVVILSCIVQLFTKNFGCEFGYNIIIYLNSQRDKEYTVFKTQCYIYDQFLNLILHFENVRLVYMFILKDTIILMYNISFH